MLVSMQPMTKRTKWRILEKPRQKCPLLLRKRIDVRRKRDKGNNGPALGDNLLLQGRILGGDLGRVVSVTTVVVAAVVLDEITSSPQEAGCAQNKVDKAPAEPQQEVDGDDGAWVDASVSSALQNANGFGDVPNKCYGELLAINRQLTVQDHHDLDGVKGGGRRTAGTRASTMIQSTSTLGVAASEPPMPAIMTKKTSDASRRASFVFHVPGGETYFGGCSCILAI